MLHKKESFAISAKGQHRMDHIIGGFLSIAQSRPFKDGSWKKCSFLLQTTLPINKRDQVLWPSHKIRSIKWPNGRWMRSDHNITAIASDIFLFSFCLPDTREPSILVLFYLKTTLPTNKRDQVLWPSHKIRSIKWPNGRWMRSDHNITAIASDIFLFSFCLPDTREPSILVLVPKKLCQ